MSKITLAIGLPACGKSTIAKQISKENGAIIHSSDELRLELFGSYDVQDRNTELFKELNNRIVNDIKQGRDVILDATNLSMKKRKHLLSLLPKESFKEAIVIATTLEDCVNRDANRDKKVGKHIINRMVKNFQFPLLQEGFDDIKVIYNSKEVDFRVNQLEYTENALDFNQDNPNHSMNLGAHMSNASSIGKAMEYKNFITDALVFHDIGKLYTKTYKDSKGNPCEFAHYYAHENVSSYISMFLFNMTDVHNHYKAQLIQYHMIPYNLKTDKSKKKWLDFFGEEMYNDIMKVHECDKLAH